MKWNKLGKIFDPTEHKLPNNCREFAKSPQALVFKYFVRIYFCSCERDKTGKYLSHVAYVDMDKALRTIIGISTKPVVPLGKLGCFDEHGIFPINPVRVGNEIYSYTCGWNRRTSVSVDTSIGLVISKDDGVTFQRTGDGPILTSSLHEPYLVGDGYVKIIDEVFHMWYMYGTDWKKFSEDCPPERVYKIGHAFSMDGVRWLKDTYRENLIPSRLGELECQALPTVIEIGSIYHMFFCYRQASDFRENRERSYRIGHAYSKDLTAWYRDDNDPALDPSPSGWDSDMLCYPNVFELDNKVYLLYNGNEFGRYGFGVAVLEW